MVAWVICVRRARFARVVLPGAPSSHHLLVVLRVRPSSSLRVTASLTGSHRTAGHVPLGSSTASYRRKEARAVSWTVNDLFASMESLTVGSPWREGARSSGNDGSDCLARLGCVGGSAEDSLSGLDGRPRRFSDACLRNAERRGGFLDNGNHSCGEGHYLRILAANPRTKGKAYNLAEGNASFIEQKAQARKAIARHVEYITVWGGGEYWCGADDLSGLKEALGASSLSSLEASPSRACSS